MNQTEADFLHDISTPFSAGLLSLQFILERLPEASGERKALEHSLDILERVGKMIRERERAIR